MTPMDFLFIATINLAWAFTFLIGKLGLEQLPPLLLAGIRFGFLLLILWPWLRVIPGKMSLVIAIGFLQGTLHFGLIFMGLAASHDISSVAVASQLYVPLATLLAWFWLGETVDLQRGLGIGIAFCGVAFLGFDPAVFNAPIGLLFVSLGALVMAMASILIRQLKGTVSPMALQAWLSAIAAPSLLFGSLLFERDQFTALATSQWVHLAAPIYSALAASLLGHGLLAYLLGRHPINVITPFLLIAPLFSIGLGVLFMGDELTPELVIGALLTLGGILLIYLPLKSLGKG